MKSSRMPIRAARKLELANAFPASALWHS
jgi:hypothetical protein